MLGIQVNGEFLDLGANTSLQIEITNPLFNVETESGAFSYETTVEESGHNRRLLGFPGSLSLRSYRKAPLPCQLWLGDRPQLFRVGMLTVGGRDKGIRVSFQGDARIMATAAEDRLRSLDLGTSPLTLSVKEPYPVDSYALFPVYNVSFLTDPVDFPEEHVNYYAVGRFLAADPHNTFRAPVCPFPYLVYLLERVFSHYGVRVTGEWVASEEARRLVVYNTYGYAGSDLVNGVVDFRNHVPDMTVGEFLKAVRGRLGLALVFKPGGREVEIVSKRAVLEDSRAADWTGITQAGFAWAPNDGNGFTLGGGYEEEDSTVKELGPDWDKVIVGNGGTLLTEGCGTLLMHKFPEYSGSPIRPWLVPKAFQKGNGVAGTEGGEFALRLLSYRGMQADLYGEAYPFATSETVNYAGGPVAPHSLLLTGGNSLYEASHRDWVEFLSETETITRTVQLGVAHLLQLDPLRKVLIRDREGYLKAFWQKVSFTVHATQGIKAAKVTFAKTMR